MPANRDELRARYDAARASAAARGVLPVLDAFESALADSHAVLGRRLVEVERLASSDRQGYATYYQLVDAQARLPDDDEWDVLRRVADATLFPGYEKDIRFLALSLDGLGIRSYGECSLVCRESMIEHRTSVFEGNSAVVVGAQSVAIRKLPSTLLGRRATWVKRAILCVAKLVDRLTAPMDQDDFARLLVAQGKTSAEDDFIEVHVHGPMTIRTFQKVLIVDKHVRRKRKFVSALRERLSRFDVELEVR